MTIKPPRKPLIPGWLLVVLAGFLVFGLGVLASSINERRAESKLARVQFLQPLDEWESDPAKWGVSFPRQFISWESTRDSATRPSFLPESSGDYLAQRPALVILWAGYSFTKAYNKPRGHYHSVEDVTGTPRVDANTPATCWTCKSPDVPRLMARDGVEAFYANSFDHYRSEVTNPIACLDCHDPQTMALRISRPGLAEAFQRQGKDVTQSSHQEMRTLVCAQCHVEYYFKGKEANHLTFPWDQGLTVENFRQYYERSGHVDWVHAISGAPMIKMQHPDYELSRAGIHAFRGVSCADCHMPYTSEGGLKYSDHGVRSPLMNASTACQVCHRWSETDVRARVLSIQGTTRAALSRAEQVLAEAHLEIGDAMSLGATDAELEGVRHQVSVAQMYWDYVASSNGLGFHAPQESARILGRAVDLAQECRLETQRIRARRGELSPLEMPDISTKEKAQAFIQPYLELQKAAAAGK